MCVCGGWGGGGGGGGGGGSHRDRPMDGLLEANPVTNKLDVEKERTFSLVHL